MSQTLTISETGLKLIKAFEGYRPVDRELVTGQRVVGYGHRLYSEDAVMMNKGEAEEVLRSDLEPFEDMINTEVHAPMTQSQFDALCSFAFNIGPKAFLKSDTLRALNNGRPLDAANGLDVWRKSEVAGKTYVVDALMRRRTAEKAMFLRTERCIAAGREDLPPVKDTTIEGLSTEDALPVFTEEDAKAVVAAPYSAAISPTRRREDGPAGVLQLSELDIVEDEELIEESHIEEAAVTAETETDLLEEDIALEEEVTALDTALDIAADTEDAAVGFELPQKRPSPIAAAATDIVARLDALIDDGDMDFEDRDKEWPDTLVETDMGNDAVETESDTKVIDIKSRSQRVDAGLSDAAPLIETAPVEAEPSKKGPYLVMDKPENEAVRPRTDSAAKYIESYAPETVVPASKSGNPLGLWIPVLLGFILLGGAAGTLIRGADALLGAWGPIIAFTGLVIGICLILAGIYARLRINRRN